MINCIIVISASLIGYIEIPHLIKVKAKMDLIVFSLLLLFGLILNLLYYNGVHIPNPLDFIKFLTKPLSEWLYRLL
ncbi:hypothetical protein GCM10011391_10240 [Pullulanibacillus camelliae]|uniref:Uncharacterized protein n=1 Tax=Pullulanibacillus camelliae TaxID=1707096 RepID=A0A8J2YDC0_9BACL|nr:hypothetical protein [Pullulanibacillus camelliae]GGE33518.1 hypothetical protein GCM10011391_10240 [Pullulanibacillus camelliae]